MKFELKGIQLVHVYMDASGSIKCGGFQLTGYWFKLPGHVIYTGALELISVVVAAMLWGDN